MQLEIASLLLVIVAIYIVVRQVVTIRAERELRESHQFAAEIISNAGEGIVVYDTQLRYLVWNRFMEELTGLAAGEVLGRKVIEVFPHLDTDGVEELLGRALNGESVDSPDFRYWLTGMDRSVWVSSVYRPHRDASGHIAGVIALVRDITDRKEAEAQIEYQAYHDTLTGLANRRLAMEHIRLAIALAQRGRHNVAVLFLDLDHFKVVNDSLGHTSGDALLVEAGQRLRGCVRDGDTVARVGGDEFIVVLQNLHKKEDAALVARKILHSVAEPFETAGSRIYATTSVGISIFPDDGADAETLIQNADNAMYRAKSAGRNTYEHATEELARSTRERLAMESGLHRAIERSEFVLHYQPQVDIRSGAIVGMEALLRWDHPERGIIPPAAFMQVAEERGFIIVIGDWVLRTACFEAKRLIDGGACGLRVAVNLSAKQFRDESLVEAVEAALRDSGLEAARLELEITETTAMQEVEHSLEIMHALRRLGVTIAIDDFGTGHSSLGYLKRFPLDTLKIDRAFVEDLPDRQEDAAIVRSILELARGLRLRVVAEGVETRPQLDFLQRHDCPEVQGFLFSYPVPALEFERLLGTGLPHVQWA